MEYGFRKIFKTNYRKQRELEGKIDPNTQEITLRRRGLAFGLCPWTVTRRNFANKIREYKIVEKNYQDRKSVV